MIFISEAIIVGNVTKKYIDNKFSEVYSKSEADNLLNEKANINDLSTVSTSGNYNDLSNKPTIPTIDSGTWTPELGVTSGNLPTYSTYYRKGQYYKIGNLVYIILDCRYQIENVTGVIGYACIKNLPFTSISIRTSSRQALKMSRCEGLSYSPGAACYILNGSNQLNLLDITGKYQQSYILNSELNSSGTYYRDFYIVFNGCYLSSQ